jgi:hypothetical protein
MEPAAILHQLIHSEDLPRDALRAATARRAEMAPLLVEQIDKFVTDGGDAYDIEGDAALFFIFHLLGQWGETSAYRALARLLRSPADDVDAALGWSITETSHKVMAAVFDGDPAPIYNIILDPNADEFVRSRMCETLAMLAVRGRLDRDEVAAFLRDCWINLQPRHECFVWQGWQSAIALLGLVELKDIVKEAFDREIICPTWLGYEHFERDLALAILHPTEPWPARPDEYELFGDAIEELSTWHCFSEEYKRERERWRNQRAPLVQRELPPLDLLLDRLVSTAPSEPITNAMRGVGRNDPCPCGSGRKYKKCCLQ